MFRQIGRLYQRFPLTVKSVVIGVVMALCASVLLDFIYTSMLDRAFERELSRRLQKEITHSQMMFGDYLKRYQQVAKLISNHEPLQRHIEQAQSGDAELNLLQQRPAWLMDVPDWMNQVSPAYLLLLDQRQVPIDAYPLREDAQDAGSLLEKQALWRDIGDTSLFRIAENQGRLCLVTIAPVIREGELLGSVAMVTPIDAELLISSQLNMISEGSALALVLREQGQIVASSRPQLLVAGTPIRGYQPDYLMAEKGLFDDGVSDQPLQLVSLVKRDQVASE